MDKTYVKVNGVWRYVYRAIDQDEQVIDALVSPRRDADSAHRFFQRALTMLKVTPSEVVTDAAAIYPAVLTSWSRRRGITSSDTRTIRSRPITASSNTDSNRCAGCRPTGPQVIIAGHAFMQNLRRGHYELAVDTPVAERVSVAFH